MNYQRVYDQIIERGKLRGISKKKLLGFERHHIIPRSFGGSNDLENLVDLTPREHFIVHWLLTKTTESEHKAKTIYAFWRMCQKNGTTKHVPTSRQYEIARKLHANLQRGNEHGLGFKHTKEQNLKKQKNER